MNLETIKQSYNDILAFNTLASNIINDPKKIDNQLSYIFEELAETIAAVEVGDSVEFIDGVCDIWVTTVGLLQVAEACGFNVEAAIKRVDANNASKFPAYGAPLRYLEGQTATLNEQYQRYVIKDAAGKVKKPIGFVGVDLDDCVPDHFIWNI